MAIIFSSKIKQSEHWEQVQFVSWFRKNYEYKIFAIPNGGYRDGITAGSLKAEGVLPGVPDLFIPKVGLWVEMKSLQGKLSSLQKEMISYLRASDNGVEYKVIVAYGYEDAINKIKEVLPIPNVPNE